MKAAVTEDCEEKAREAGAISTKTGAQLTDEENRCNTSGQLARQFAQSQQHRYGETYRHMILNRQKMMTIPLEAE